MSTAADSVIFNDVRQTVVDTLGLSIPLRLLDAQTPLLGAVPELDSMGVVLLLTALEDRFDLALSDDDINSAWFETLGSLTEAIEARLPQ
jgi:acyl carrier protein